MPAFSEDRVLPNHHLITVFEAANDTLKEAYVGTSSFLIDQLVKKFQARPPKPAAHWKKEHRLFFRCVGYSVAVRDAKAFIKKYAKSDALKGWKVLTG